MLRDPLVADYAQVGPCLTSAPDDCRKRQPRHDQARERDDPQLGAAWHLTIVAEVAGARKVALQRDRLLPSAAQVSRGIPFLDHP